MALEYLTVEHVPLPKIIKIFAKISIGPKVQWNGTSCWVAIRPDANGYGRIGYKEIFPRAIKLHRFMLAWLIHPIPIGREHGEIDHLCRNRACCNPIHLEFVSRQVNVLRGESFAAVNAKKTHCKRGHLLEGKNVYENSLPRRACVICSKENCTRNYYERYRLPHLRRDVDGLT